MVFPLRVLPVIAEAQVSSRFLEHNSSVLPIFADMLHRAKFSEQISSVRLYYLGMPVGAGDY
jgi:hypothetical protein